MANFDLSKVSQSVINFIDQLKNEDGDSTNKLTGKEILKIGDYLAGNKELNDNDKKYLMNEIEQNLLDSNAEQKDRFSKLKGIFEDITKLSGANRNDTNREHISLIQGPEAEIFENRKIITKNPDGTSTLNVSHGMTYPEIIEACYPKLLETMNLTQAIHLLKDTVGIDRKSMDIPKKIVLPAELGGVKLDENSAEKLKDNMDKYAGADGLVNNHSDDM